MRAVLSFALILSSLAMAQAETTLSPVGKKVDPFTLRDYRGAERSLQEFADHPFVVLAFTGTECPVAKLYALRLAELSKEYGPKGVTFLGISANQQDSITALVE